MDFELSPELGALRVRVRDFMNALVIPAEETIIAEDKRKHYDALKHLQGRAKAEGLWTPHLPVALGGQGLGVMGMCALFREMGRSPVGARVFHCDSPRGPGSPA